MILANAAVGIIQLIIAIILAVIALYIGFAVLNRITRGIDEEKELAVVAGVRGYGEVPGQFGAAEVAEEGLLVFGAAVLPLQLVEVGGEEGQGAGGGEDGGGSRRGGGVHADHSARWGVTKTVTPGYKVIHNFHQSAAVTVFVTAEQIGCGRTEVRSRRSVISGR